MISRRGLLQAAAILPLVRPNLARAALRNAAVPAVEVPMAQRPKIRWWWPGGAIDPAEVTREVDILADAGFGGFEIADVRDSITVPMDPKVYGWGGDRWFAGLKAALQAAERRHLKPDLTIGAHWPTAIPGVMPDDDAASKELVHGEASVNGGAMFRGPLPPPIQATPSGEIPGVNEHLPIVPRLIAVQAFRVLGSGAPTRLDRGSMIDLSGAVRDGSLDWAAPAGANWRVITFWERGTGQIQNMFQMNRTASMLSDPKPFVVDIYGRAGAKAVMDYWDSHILTPAIRTLVRRTGASLFEDSLEMSAARNWTPEMLSEFERRRGYSLVPYLALLPSTKADFAEMILGRTPPGVYDLSGVDRSRVIDDFDRTLAEMYDENRVSGIAQWAHGHGMTFRVQVVGSNVDSGTAAAIADIPEGDNSNDIQGWRRFAAGRDIGRKRVLSDEAGTFVGGNAHVATWRDLLYMLQRDYAGGVNQVVIHGTPYADAPGAKWPGFSAFGRAIGNDWAPRDPNWAVVNDATAVIGRIQIFLQTGRQVTDLAVLGSKLKSLTLQQAGYSWQYPSEELLKGAAMRLGDGALMPDGPSYRALVINRVDSVDPETANQLLGFADAGLPIVIVGRPPASARSWKDAASNDQKVRQQFRRLRAHSSVRTVTSAREVARALKTMNVQPSMGFSGGERIIGIRRRAGLDDLYFLLNDSDDRTKQTFRLEGSGRLYRDNQWTGESEEVPARVNGPYLVCDLELAKDEVMLLRLTPNAPVAIGWTASAKPIRHIDLADWNLAVEDWLPGSGHSIIRKRIHRFSRQPLRAWSEIPQLAQVSGVGRYRSSVHLPFLEAGTVAWLDLGQVGGTPRVYVNGRRLPPVNLFTLRVELSRWLRSGENAIEVMIATPLNNRLRALGIESVFAPPPGAEGPPMSAPQPSAGDPDEADGPVSMPGMQPGAAPPGTKRVEQRYGLLGPVTLTLAHGTSAPAAE